MDRMKERKKEERSRNTAVRKQKLLQYKRILRSKLPIFTRYLLILLSFSLFLYIVAGTDLFTIDSVKINSISESGFKYTNSEDLLFSAEEIVIGENFFLLNPNVVTSELLRDYPYVKSVYSEKKFPSLLEMRVTEKNVLFIVEFGNDCLPIDDEGEIVTSIEKEGDCREVAALQKAIYTKVSEEDYDSIRSQRGFFIFEQLYQLLGMLGDLGFEVGGIEVTERKVTISNMKGVMLIFDPFEEFETQLKRATLVLSGLDSQDQMKEIDFRFIRPVQR